MTDDELAWSSALHDCEPPTLHLVPGVVNARARWGCPTCGQRWDLEVSVSHRGAAPVRTAERNGGANDRKWIDAARDRLKARNALPE